VITSLTCATAPLTGQTECRHRHPPLAEFAAFTDIDFFRTDAFVDDDFLGGEGNDHFLAPDVTMCAYVDGCTSSQSSVEFLVLFFSNADFSLELVVVSVSATLLARLVVVTSSSAGVAVAAFVVDEDDSGRT